ncbi:cysteine dioxygenase [Novosphingobium flavum]|nr:cysteine dioxygenase [Novosphingobium flavum]
MSSAAPDPAPNLARLRGFIVRMADLVAHHRQERDILAGGSDLLADLVRHDDWLPERYARPHPDRYQQYLLHCDSRERFCVVSFVWGPGQATPVHDHRVWGLVGVLRGAEEAQGFARGPDGLIPVGPPQILGPGEVDAVSPRIGDIHRVANAVPDGTSISIHVYGANIGAVARSVLDDSGAAHPFISGYADCPLPNLWQPV